MKLNDDMNGSKDDDEESNDPSNEDNLPRKFSYTLTRPPNNPHGGQSSPIFGGRSASLIPSQLLSLAKYSDDKKGKGIKSHSIHGMGEEDKFNRPHQEMGQLSYEEKRFLLAVERGDVASVRRMLIKSRETGSMNINCVDPLGRSALLMAIDNENLEMVELLIEFKEETKDALLHAINEEYVEAVEVLLEHEETIHTPGELHSWEAVPPETATFTPDITPLILAAHRDNYEIIKILLDRGGTLPMPHDLRCGCDECVTSRLEDSLRHSRSRINAYRALASPSLIALSSKDPILTAFELSWELRRLSFLEHEFRSEYQELRKQCQDFATALLDHTRSSYELEVLLNHDPSGPPFEHGERMSLNRLKLAIKLKQKKFVAHPNVQQLLASIWYEGLPGFRRKNMVLQSLEIIKIGLLFPIFSIVYILAPHTTLGRTMRKPFIKFICNSASYFTFLSLLTLASQRIEGFVSEWFETHSSWKKYVSTDVTTRRGAPPSLVEWLILAWVFGLIWSEIKQLWDIGLREYIRDMWNVLDFITNALYVATIALRIVAYHQVQQYPKTKQLTRKNWDTWDPMIIAEGLFAAANIFSNLKLVYIFSVNPYLGPLQVSLSRMVVDILKFAFLYVLTLFAFSCGLNQLLWFYADLEKKACDNVLSSEAYLTSDPEPDVSQCNIWRRFANLFETTQTLFWAAFGLVDLQNFELEGIKPFTRFWGMLMFGTYSVINVIVLLNLLIAMMNHSYQLVSERADIEWKFARSKLWISYFEEGNTAPPPFNIIVAPKSIYYLCRWVYQKFCGRTKKAKKEHIRTIRGIMRNLVRRYVTLEQRKAENQGVTEDDVNEIKQNISAFRCELVEILKNSGMNTSTASISGHGAGGKKNRQKERRLMKGFNIGLNSLDANLTGSTPLLATTTIESNEYKEVSQKTKEINWVSEVVKRSPVNKLSRLVRLAEQRLGRPTNKKRWGNLVEATKTANVRKLLTKSQSEDSSASEGLNEHDMDDLPQILEEGNSPTSIRTFNNTTDYKPQLTRSFSSELSNMPLDPSHLTLHHVQEVPNKYNSKRHTIISHVGSSWSVSENEGELIIPSEGLDLMSSLGSYQTSTNQVSLSISDRNQSYSSYRGSGNLRERRPDKMSVAISVGDYSSERVLTASEAINSPDGGGPDVLPIDSSPTAKIREPMTYSVEYRGSPRSETFESIKPSQPRPLAGIQPITKNMPGGWL